MEPFVVDPRQTTPTERAEYVRQAQVLYNLNHTLPFTDEYNALVKDLFGKDNLGENVMVHTPLKGVCFDQVKLGDNVVVMSGGLMMSRGVTVGENAVVAAGAIVTKDVAPNTIVGGNPAKFIKNV